MTALEVRNVSKVYPLRGSQWARFRQVLTPGKVHYVNGLFALRDVSFTVKKGETFGIVGANGSGKSTLLQIVAGILLPTDGSVAAHGRLSALLELGSGFSPEFTGRQNVLLNAAILGLSSAEIEDRFETIERFAAIGDFIDQPVRTYSTGMTLRLAFAVVAHVDPEILVVDEALAVGDIAFRQRCMRRIHDLRAGGVTVLFVSHDTGDVKALCERCLWLENGGMRMLGDSDEVVTAYLHAMSQREQARDASEKTARFTSSRRYGRGGAEVTHAELIDSAGNDLRAWVAGKDAVLRIHFRVHVPLDLPIAGFLVRNEKGETIFGSNTARENYPLPRMQPDQDHRVDFHWVMPKLAAGRYFITVGIASGVLDEFETLDYVEDAICIDAPPNDVPRNVYLQLHCASVNVYGNG